MKDSGVEWLGEVPYGWVITRLKHRVLKLTDGEHIAPKFTDSGMRFLSAKDIRDREINYEVTKFVSQEDGVRFRKRCDPKIDDLLVVSRGATIGRVGLVEKDIVFCLLGSVILVRANVKELHPLFLFYLLNQDVVREQFLLASQSSAQQAIYLVDISEIFFALPPIDEQRKIAEYLEKQVGRLDHLVNESMGATSLLTERRTALISAAVTGKIDVRNWQPPEPHQPPARMPEHHGPPLRQVCRIRFPERNR